ncbi:MAG: transglycosylase SLT domain-containing protein, partial [Nitrospinota bacterium]|nr:transglycosylase SLT domain-containing protein [Nitrospinota bacterium]
MRSENIFHFTALKHSFAAIVTLSMAPLLLSPAQAVGQMLVADSMTDPSIRYVRAQEYLRKGKKIEARAELEMINFQRDFILADYVAYDLASLSLEENDPAAAASYLRNAARELVKSPLRKDANKLYVLANCQDPAAPECEEAMTVINKRMTPSGFMPGRLIIAAKREEKSGRLSEAYDYYSRILYKHPASPEVSLATDGIKRLRAHAGKAASSLFLKPSYKDKLDRAMKLMKAYRYNEAATALQLMIAEGQDKEKEASLLYKLGDALFKARRREEAREVFVKFSSDFPKHDKRQKSEYYIAIIDWNKDLNVEAENRLKKLAAGGKRDVTGLALYTLGRIAESRGDWGAAGAHYTKAARHRLPSRLKNDMRWRLGWVEYKKGSYTKAAKFFNHGASKKAKYQQSGRFLYWQAKSYHSVGATAQAGKAEAKLDKMFPYTYYGLADTANGLKARPAPNSIVDIDSIPMEEAKPPKRLSQKGQLILQRFELLIQAGLNEGAKRELNRLLHEIRKVQSSLAWLGTLYVRAGAAHKAMTLFGPTPNDGQKSDDFGDVAWRLVYPVNHWDEIAREAMKANIDPLLPLAVIRQESAFNHKALSSANAIGLMPVVQ